MLQERNGGSCDNDPVSDGDSCLISCKHISESSGNSNIGTFNSIFLRPKTSKFFLGIFIGVGASVFFIVLVALTVAWIYLKKPEILDSLNKTRKPNILLPVEKDSSNRESIIFEKGDDLKNTVVFSTLFLTIFLITFFTHNSFLSFGKD